MATTVDRARHAEEDLAGELARILGEAPMNTRELAVKALSSDGAELVRLLEEAITRLAADSEPEAADEGLWGVPPDPAGLAAIREQSELTRRRALQSVLADALTREEAAARLLVSPQAVSKRVGSGRLIALSRGRLKLLPAWQFGDDGPLPGLEQVIAAYPGSALSLSVWATRPSPDLDGLTPAVVLARRGGLSRVLAAIEPLDAAGW